MLEADAALLEGEKVIFTSNTDHYSPPILLHRLLLPGYRS